MPKVSRLLLLWVAAQSLVSIVVADTARAALPRGTLKIDVRDVSGKAIEAKVTVQPEKPLLTESPGADHRAVVRQGDVYVADGLTDGNWIVEVEGAPPQLVRVFELRTSGIVFVVGPAKPKKPAPRFNQPSRPCEALEGVLVEAIAFEKGRLAAGQLAVHQGKKVICGATIAGGGASLKLPVGTFNIDAVMVGGGHAHAVYAVRVGRTPPPLVLRSN